MKVISCINQKGGVGKTVTSLNLSAALSRNNYRVLMIDTDRQCNLSKATKRSFDKTIFDAFMGEELPIYEVNKDLDIIPCSPKIEELIPSLTNQIGGHCILKEKIEALDYDYIIIDNAPTLNIVSVNTMFAADTILIPLNPSEFGYDGLEEIMEKVNQINTRIGGNIQDIYILFTMVKHGKIYDQIKQSVRENYENVLTTEIRHNVSIEESIADPNHIDIFGYNFNCAGAADYYKLYKEWLQKQNTNERLRTR